MKLTNNSKLKSNEELTYKSIEFYKFVDQNNKDFKMNSIRFWKNRNECKEALFPCYPNTTMDQIQQYNNLTLVRITNDPNYIINVINWGPEAMLTINYKNPNQILDYLLVQIADNEKTKEEKSYPYDNMFFYLQPMDISIADTQNASCKCWYILDQWMTFGQWFNEVLEDSNIKVKRLRQFKNRFLLNKDYVIPTPNNEKK